LIGRTAWQRGGRPGKGFSQDQLGKKKGKEKMALAVILLHMSPWRAAQRWWGGKGIKRWEKKKGEKKKRKKRWFGLSQPIDFLDSERRRN